MITVFYDGKCGLCRREIEHYRCIAPPRAFRWVDITVEPQPLLDLGISQRDGLRELRVQDAGGRVHAGVDSFVTIWRQIPRYRFLAFLVGSRPIHGLARTAYRRFADWHFKHMGYQKCDI